ncbi:MAG: hypothetical protein EAZ77_08670 [Nostocales cyanobacterium]|nr:MAG: hypothetical protein EAZ77_08670 [Nostocales cyanobacterium]
MQNCLKVGVVGNYIKIQDMGRRKSAAELTELAAKKKSQEAARKAAREASPKPYKARPETDFSYGFYVDPLDNDAACRFRIPKDSLDLYGGLAKIGLVATLPTGKAQINIGKGNKRVIFRVRWFFGNATPEVVPETAAHGRWIRFADKTAGKYTHVLPFGASAAPDMDATPSVDTLILRFTNLFNTPTEISRLLGAKGVVVLEQGYGSKYITMAKVSA